MVKPGNKKTKKKLSRSALVLIIACIIIAIPILVFLGIIISASLNTGKPILGNRFTNDLNPAITKENEDAINLKVKSMSGVENVEVVMTTAQFRINVDAKDSISEEEIETLAQNVYDTVDSELPIRTYFTMSNAGEKMYDLSINVYNFIPKTTDDEDWLSYLITKNSKMEEPSKERLDKAKDQNLADELRYGITSEQNTTDGEDTPIEDPNETSE